MLFSPGRLSRHCLAGSTERIVTRSDAEYAGSATLPAAMRALRHWWNAARSRLSTMVARMGITYWPRRLLTKTFWVTR